MYDKNTNITVCNSCLDVAFSEDSLEPSLNPNKSSDVQDAKLLMINVGSNIISHHCDGIASGGDTQCCCGCHTEKLASLNRKIKRLEEENESLREFKDTLVQIINGFSLSPRSDDGKWKKICQAIRSI
tara:strand:+ start:209 stop:592 length:384 start_codon:yes stop_codon:yes gene_type:complete